MNSKPLRRSSTILVSFCIFGFACAANLVSAQTPQIDVLHGCAPIISVEKANCEVESISKCRNGFVSTSYRKGKPHLITEFTSDFDQKGYEVRQNPPGSFKYNMRVGNGMSIQQLLSENVTRMDRLLTAKNSKFFSNGQISVQYKLKPGTRRVGGAVVRTGTVVALVKEGANEARTSGTFYAMEDLGVLFLGAYSQTLPDGSKRSYKAQPRAIHRPGSQRFLFATSRYGCGS